MQAGTNKNMRCTDIIIHTTGQDGIDIKDYDLANETFFITNYTSYNYGLTTEGQVALDVRGPVLAVNISANITNGADMGVRLRHKTVQGRDGTGSISGLSIVGDGVNTGSIGLDIASNSNNWTISDVTCDGTGLALRFGLVGGIINGLAAKNIFGTEALSLSGEGGIFSNFNIITLPSSSRVVDFEPTASNIQLNNFNLTDNSGGAAGIRIQAGCANIALSSGTLKNSAISDGGTATTQSDIRLI